MSYTQTELYRHTPEGAVARTVTYIPSRLAVAGKTIQLKDGESWFDWVVERAGIAITELVKT